MKGVFVASTIVAALFSGGWSQPASPTGPASVGSGSPGGYASADSAAPPGADRDLPFRGSFTGTQVVTVGAGSASVSGSATGTATHLGLFTVEFPHTVDFATRVGDGTYTFSTANGDMLIGDFIGQAEGAPPLITIVEHVTITGGTGRFAGATGSFTSYRSFNQATGVTEGSFEGTISSVGVGRR